MQSVTAFIVSILILICLSSFLNDVPPKYTTIEYLQTIGYPSESHYVTTFDGYILNLHRIPPKSNSKPNGKVVLLQHGIVTTSFQWLISGPGKALAFILADAGYDVWMGNSRGTALSRNHTSMNPDTNNTFWKFSWHEIGIYDLPASIDYILDVTKSNSLYYVGHSQGSTAMYVMASEIPEYNRKIKFYAHLAPTAFVSRLRSPLFKFFAGLQTVFPDIAMYVFGIELLPARGIMQEFLAAFCAQPIASLICEYLLFYMIFGFSPTETNTTLLPFLFAHFPAGSSSIQLNHYFQEYNSGHFRQYDYGHSINMEKYGSTEPPDYDLSKVTAPGYLIYAANDWLGDFVYDVPKLYNNLGNCTGKFLVPIESFNHMDHLLGMNVTRLVYSKVLKLFDEN